MALSKAKGQISFTIKAFMLIASVIAFAILLLFVNSFSQNSEKKQEAVSFQMQALGDLQKLISDKNCLAYDVDGISQKGVIDSKKLEDFVSKYPDQEPACALEGEFDYNVNVAQDKVNLTIYSHFPGDLEYIFNDINGKRTAFLIDTSASMNEECGTYNDEPKKKIECVEIFLKTFIDRLDPKSQVALYTYPEKRWVFRITELDQNKLILKNSISLSANGGTPMCAALDEAFRYSGLESIDRIILLTDGCENSDECWIGDSLKSVQNNLDKEIPIHTIAFGEDVEKCSYLLKDIANITDGVYYRAKNCEDLAGKTPQYSINKAQKNWTFGVQEFSPQKAKSNEQTVTLPVTIRYDSKNYLGGSIYMKAVSGQLEAISSAINKICLEGRDQKLTLQMKVNYPLKYSAGKLCINSEGGICKTIDCPIPVEFEEITASGNYIMDIQRKGGKVVVKS